jgi:hypothetical protein
MTDGLALLAAWVEFLVLLSVLSFVVLRGDRSSRADRRNRADRSRTTDGSSRGVRGDV